MPFIKAKKRLPATSTFMRCIRQALIVFYLAITVGGCAVLGIGIWTLVTDYGGQRLSGMIGAHLYLIDSYLLIASGVCILLVSLCGCCGVMFEYKCLLGLHMGIMSFLSISLIAGGCLGFVFRNELEDSLWRKLELSVKDKYGTKEYPSLTRAWDEAQLGLECCGAHGNINSTTSWHIYQQSVWYKSREANRSHVPPSCCIPTVTDCDLGEIDPALEPPVSNFISHNITFFTTGCYERMRGALVANGLVIGVITIVVATTIIVQVALSVCLYRNVR